MKKNLMVLLALALVGSALVVGCTASDSGDGGEATTAGTDEGSGE